MNGAPRRRRAGAGGRRLRLLAAKVSCRKCRASHELTKATQAELKHLRASLEAGGEPFGRCPDCGSSDLKGTIT